MSQSLNWSVLAECLGSANSVGDTGDPAGNLDTVTVTVTFVLGGGEGREANKSMNTPKDLKGH